ncbi:hypothetical protein P153DRAFT_174780 [Dothidotthia symphoricarpi CBS 119687]|uniref:Uncharacterized protein n=1 Tax=Dothidotthia symphoricarpi CBS 119687 TaxID=1392245 RepID=A0A6A6ALH5_9PLEO|nr:uncharacterized protein P153DRAFT_174780 [Dothidotthia symphoricarpi CBS 119687]KAF2132832.1 hypothetical protein P153DRAFT_174780 [Dothidotthia symphoricarpi CBS 119687]
MSSIDVPALFTALIILTALVLFLIILCVSIRCIKRHLKSRQSEPNVEVGRTMPQERFLATHSEVTTQQRRISSASQSIELLPEIRTSSERADDWLERRGARLDEGVDPGVVKVLKTYKMLDVKHDGPSRWNGRNEEDVSELRVPIERDFISYKYHGEASRCG